MVFSLAKYSRKIRLSNLISIICNSYAFATSLLLYGISCPFMAALIEVIDLKKMMTFAMATLLVGILLTFFMFEPWQLILIWGIIILLASGLFLTVLSPYIANHLSKLYS
jgi:MFS family permease